MARNISDLFDLSMTLYENEETSIPLFNPMQGRIDTNFLIRLQKGGELVTVDSSCSVTAKFFCYEVAKPTILKSTYEISPKNPDGSPNVNYNITILDNIIKIPANLSMTDFAGNIKMTLIINCTSISGDSISIPYYYLYTVSPLAGYQQTGGNVNLIPYAKTDLDNVATSVFTAKAAQSGILPGGGVTRIDGGGA